MVEGRPPRGARGEDAPPELGELRVAVERLLQARAAADRELAAAILLLAEICAERPAPSAPAESRPDLYKPKEVQQLLGIGSSNYYRIVSEGLLPYTRLTPGGDRVHTRANLEEYLRHLDETTRHLKSHHRR